MSLYTQERKKLSRFVGSQSVLGDGVFLDVCEPGFRGAVSSFSFTHTYMHTYIHTCMHYSHTQFAQTSLEGKKDSVDFASNINDTNSFIKGLGHGHGTEPAPPTAASLPPIKKSTSRGISGSSHIQLHHTSLHTYIHTYMHNILSSSISNAVNYV